MIWTIWANVQLNIIPTDLQFYHGCAIHFWYAFTYDVDWICGNMHDDVIKWKHFPRYWPFVRGIHRSPVNSPHKGQWRGALKFSLICTLNKQFSKQWEHWWFETPWRPLWHCNAAAMLYVILCWMWAQSMLQLGLFDYRDNKISPFYLLNRLPPLPSNLCECMWSEACWWPSLWCGFGGCLSPLSASSDARDTWLLLTQD